MTTITPIRFDDALGERYLAYAMSTIMSRSLPDVRDGLKPVHRRLLYAMLQLKLNPNSGFKKCARVVGDVIGKYHPHGDQAVYGTMVRLAQLFASRYPLVDGQGNFGSIDGDNAAAMRYTEARLTAVAMALLNDIDQDTVDFKPTYDGDDVEPVLLPANFPNLLANGSEGIAVGMATSIPPHNVGEICSALLYVIKHPNTKIEKLVELIPGPDFPTGGIIVEPKETIIKAYQHGKGSFRMRAKWEKEALSHGQYQIVISEIPYQIQKAKLIEKIAELFKAKKLPLLANIRDESTDEMRIILEPKNRSVDPELLMESMFKHTDLETRFSLNMNALTKDQIPKVHNLQEVLHAFLEHRHEVLIRKSNYRLTHIDRRLHILEGYLIAYLNLDEVIRIIREEDEPKAVMMQQFKLSDNQTEAILNMRLRALRKLEEITIKDEHKALSEEKALLEALLTDETLRWKQIAADIKQIKKQFGTGNEGKRRTEFGEAIEGVHLSKEAFIEKESITVICSHNGWIRTQKGHKLDRSSFKYKEGDQERFVIETSTTDKLIIFTASGRFYTILCDDIDRKKGFGEPLSVMVDLAADDHIISLHIHQAGQKLLVASYKGKGFLVAEEAVMAQTKAGKKVLNPAKGDRGFICRPVSGDHIAIIGENRKLLLFPITEIPEMKRGQGALLQRYRQGGVADITFCNVAQGLSWQLGGRIRTEEDITPWIGKRSNMGRLPPVGFPRSNRFTIA